MADNKYYAHSANAKGDWHPLKDHLRNVAALAKKFAEEARPGDAEFASAAYSAGLLHDLGKYQNEFQDYLNGNRKSSWPHSPLGAVKGLKYGLFHSFSPAGHHAGLPAKEDLKSIENNWGGRISNLWVVACRDFPGLATLHPPKIPEHIAKNPFIADIFIRMVFSSLVDADWSDTNAWKEGKYPYQYTPVSLGAGTRLKQILKHLAGKSHEGSINVIRGEVLQHCLTSSESVPGFFSLTVPTGGGKTLASLAFALQHCESHKKQHGPRRIIYVIPYLTILEQTAKTFYEALKVGRSGGIILEHHSLAYTGRFDADKTDKNYGNEESQSAWSSRMAENWDAPIVLTTSVQFFESLFSNRPAAARKLHNIARSVVIFDECQTFPAGLYTPTFSVLQELVNSYGVSFVFCTATQPAVKQSNSFVHGIPTEKLREIIPEPAKIFYRMHQRSENRMPRISVSWPENNSSPVTWQEIAGRMCQAGSALAVVNLKAHARKLFEALGGKYCRDCPADVFHLSSMMCPQHRLERLDTIRKRLSAGKPCLVASTQLVEAGVDLDFPAVFRALGPLDSITQAAGRCNREGNLKDADGNEISGKVIIFTPELSDSEKETPPGEYRAGTDVTKEFLESARIADRNGPDILAPAIFEKYFATLMGRLDLDSKAIQGDPANSPRDRLNFPEVSRLYRLIDSKTFQVVIPYSSDGNSENSPIQNILKGIHNRKRVTLNQARQLQPYLVNMYQSDFNRAQSMMLLLPIDKEWWEWIGDYDINSGILFSPRKLPVQ